MANNIEMQKYYNYKKEYNYKAIIEKIERKEKNTNKNKILKVVATIVITIIGTMGIVAASTQIYNTYILKQKDGIDMKGVYKVPSFEIGEKIYEYDYNQEKAGFSVYSDKDKTQVFYKILADEKEYTEWKEKVDALPEKREINFNNSFVIIIGLLDRLQLHKIDSTVSEVTADDTTTSIILKPKDNPNYDKITNYMYAIIDRSLLRENIKIETDSSKYRVENEKPLEQIPLDYREEEAIEDGCVVISGVREHGTDIIGPEIVSENKNAIDEFIENAMKGNEGTIRVCIFRKSTEYTNHIYDIQYKDGIFIVNLRVLGGDNPDHIGIDICKYIVKTKENNGLYAYNESDIEPDYVNGEPRTDGKLKLFKVKY